MRLEVSCSLMDGQGDVIIHGPITQEVENVFQRGMQLSWDLADRGEFTMPDLVGRDIVLRLSVPGANDLPIGGDSYGLALAIALAAAFAGRTLSPEIVITGGLGEDGTLVTPVGGICEKRALAKACRFKWMILPSSQLDFFSTEIDQVPVETVYEAWGVLRYGQ
jgi:predicted ATP-dependent protease